MKDPPCSSWVNQLFHTMAKYGQFECGVHQKVVTVTLWIIRLINDTNGFSYFMDQAD
jgi:hypothetical protein